MRCADSVDFRNVGSLVEFLCAIQESSCSLDTDVDIDGVLQMFASHGYVPCVNVGYADINAIPHWIVNDALMSLHTNGFIHPNIHQHVRWWKEKQNVVP